MAEVVRLAGMDLTLGEPEESIRNGFMIEGKGFVKNCSFTAVLDTARERCEAEVAKLLFD